MKSVAIIEDERMEANKLREYLHRFSKESGESFAIECFDKPILFLTNYNAKYDLVFMDIDLPDLDGMTAAQKLRELDKTVTLIFVTNMAKLAVKGYEVEAFDFIVKPVFYDNFKLKLQRALAHIAARETKYILINTEAGKMRIDTAKLTYVEIIKHKLLFHTFDGIITSYGTLKQTEESIGDPLFVRCNNCYLVNLRFVSALQSPYAVVNGEQLLISSPRRAKFEKALTDYLCGGAFNHV